MGDEDDELVCDILYWFLGALKVCFIGSLCSQRLADTGVIRENFYDLCLTTHGIIYISNVTNDWVVFCKKTKRQCNNMIYLVVSEVNKIGVKYFFLLSLDAAFNLTKHQQVYNKKKNNRYNRKKQLKCLQITYPRFRVCSNQGRWLSGIAICRDIPIVDFCLLFVQIRKNICCLQLEIIWRGGVLYAIQTRSSFQNPFSFQHSAISFTPTCLWYSVRNSEHFFLGPSCRV